MAVNASPRLLALPNSLGVFDNRSPLESLPFELREQIFGELFEVKNGRGTSYFQWNYNNCIPPIVVALRSSPAAYKQALTWFAKTYFYPTLDYPTNGRPMLDLAKAELAVIPGMGIAIDLIVGSNQYRSDGIIKPTFFTKYLLDMTSLRRVDLFFDFNLCRVYRSDMEDFITGFPLWLQGCKKLNHVKVEIPISGLDDPKRSILIQGVVRRALKRTGVLGKRIEEDYYGVNNPQWGYNHRDCEIWEWKAAEGQFMDWSQEIGWMCTKRPSVFVHPPWTIWTEQCGLEFEDGVFVVKLWNQVQVVGGWEMMDSDW